MKKVIYLFCFFSIIGCGRINEINNVDQGYLLFSEEIQKYESFNEENTSSYYQKFLETNNLIYSLNLVNYPNFYETNSFNVNYDNILLVNKHHGLNKNYVPKDLVKVTDLNYINRPNEEMLLEANTLKALKDLFSDALEKKIELCLFSGYRDFEKQLSLWDDQPTFDNMYKAVPGHSEHQTGLAADISTKDVGLENSKNEAYQYLKENAHKYGFILRYPKDQEAITGYSYEPWHFRYVGDISTFIYENQLTLEEYIYKYVEIKEPTK